jgi:hypothetical protein
MQEEPPADEYDRDFVLWAAGQAAALRDRRCADLDFVNLAQEVEGLSRSDRREIPARLKRIAIALLKLEYQPERAGLAWRETVIMQVSELDDVLEASPSLRDELPASIAAAYSSARSLAAAESGLPIHVLPETPSAQFACALEAALAGEPFEL